MHPKTFNAIFKNGFNVVLGSIPRLPSNICISTIFLCKLIQFGTLLCPIFVQIFITFQLNKLNKLNKLKIKFEFPSFCYIKTELDKF